MVGRSTYRDGVAFEFFENPTEIRMQPWPNGAVYCGFTIFCGENQVDDDV